MADPIENPPQIRPEVEDGYVKITTQEWALLMLWLQKFKSYVQSNLP